jgi:hypothetical protein
MITCAVIPPPVIILQAIYQQVYVVIISWAFEVKYVAIIWSAIKGQKESDWHSTFFLTM